MTNERGYVNPAAKGAAGDPPGTAKGAVGPKNPGPSKGYSNGNKSEGETHGPAIGNSGGGKKSGGYDDAGIGNDTSKPGYSKKKTYG